MLGSLVGATLTATIAVRRHDGVKPIAIPGSFFKPLVRLQLSKPRGPGASELDLCCSTIRCISAVNICSRLLLRSDCQALRTIRVTGLGYGSTIPFLNRFLSRGRAPSRVSPRSSTTKRHTLDHPSKLAERRDLQRVGQYTE